MKQQLRTLRDVLGAPAAPGSGARQEIAQAVLRLTQILEATSDAIWDLDVSTGQVWYSRNWYEMLGYDADDPPWDDRANPFLHVIHPDDRDAVLQILDDHVNGRTSVYRARFRLRHGSGTWKWVLSRGKAIEWNEAGCVSRIIGTHMDISEWQALAAENVQAERRHAALLRSVPDLIFLITRRGVILDYHATRTDLLAAPPERFLERNIREVLPEAVVEDSIRLFGKALDEGRTLTHEYSLETRGQRRHFEARITPYDRDCVSNIVRDVTPRVRASEKLRQAEERLRHAERLHTIGQLASGIAHDFNNQMNNVMFLGDMLHKRAADPEKVKRYADMMVRRATASSELTTKLLSFARAKAGRPEALDLHDLLREVLSLLEYTVSKRIRVAATLRARNTTIVADRSQLENALLNLAINARDAMARGGELTIATDNVDLEAGECRFLESRHERGQYIMVAVQDTGVGIPPENLPGIFKPFFTTKRGEMGCGLGLATVADTLRMVKGSVAVESRPSVGSRFRVYIPVRSERPVQRAPESGDLPRGSGQLIVVDDETLFREVIGEELQAMGYDVTLCADGHEADRQYRRRHGAFDVAIIDVAMPGMDGVQLARRMRRGNPEQKLILISGTTLEKVDADLNDLQPYRFLGKPIRPEKLAAVIGDLCAQQKSSGDLSSRGRDEGQEP